MSFNPEKFRNKIEESKRRIDIACSFKEPDCLPIQIKVSGTYFAWMCGYNIKEYFLDREIMVDVQLKGLEWCFEHLKDDRIDYSIYLQLGIIYEGLFFDCPIEYPDNAEPRIVPKLKTEEDIDKLEVPDPATHPKIEWVFQEAEKTKRIMKKKGINLPFNFDFGIHPPLSAACAIMDPTDVYTMMYTNPQAIKKLFDKLLDAFFKIRDYMDKRLGIKRKDIGLANDNSAFISNKMYREMVLPYDKAIYERYGKNRRYLHADGPNDHNFKTFCEDLKIDYMDIGGWSSLKEAVKVMKGKTVIFGGLNNKDLYKGLDDSAKEKIKEAVRIAAPGGGYIFGIGGETYPGVSPETLIKLVDYVKRIGKYPIKL